MAFNRTIRDQVSSLASASAVVNVRSVNVALTTGALNVNLPASGVLSPTISSGYVRVKHTTNAVGTNASCGITGVWGTDGTNTWRLYGGDGGLAGNGVLLDESIEFKADYGLTQVTVGINNQNNGSTFDIELCGNS